MRRRDLLLSTAFAALSREAKSDIHASPHPQVATAPPAMASISRSPIAYTAIGITDDFWAPRIARNQTVTLPFELSKIVDRQDWLLDSGILEAAIYTTAKTQDPAVRTKVAVAMAQIDAIAGYVPENRDFEIVEASKRAFGETPALDHSLRRARELAKLMRDKDPPYSGMEREALCCAALYRVSHDPAHLALADHYLAIRGRGDAIGKSRHTQSHMAVTEQAEAVGHAVNGLTLILSLLEVGELSGREDYLRAGHRLWSDIVATKIYITGGVGSSGNEGFGPAYWLPNLSAYSETCASVMFCRVNHRLFLQTGDARYVDLYERTMYNALLSGVSLRGDAFFYVNRLASAGGGRDQRWRHASLECCPPNLARFLAIMPEMIYTREGQSGLAVNLYVSGTAETEFDRQRVRLDMHSTMPWGGNSSLSIHAKEPFTATIRFRIPGWARGEAIPGGLYQFVDEHWDAVRMALNGHSVDAAPDASGYAAITREWRDGDRVAIEFPMPVRRIIADERVAHCGRRYVVQRGPIVYCAEGADQPEGQTLNLVLPPDARLSPRYDTNLLGGVVVIDTQGYLATGGKPCPIRLIPYAVWANRGVGEMSVWIAREPYKVGDIGPAGGLIFYVNPQATSDGWRYLEAAPADQSRGAMWGKFRQPVAGASGTAIGTGQRNTKDMLDAHVEAGSAAWLAANYEVSDIRGWFLPSRNELAALYKAVGNMLPESDAQSLLDNCEYWTSSQISTDMANHIDFSDNGRVHGDDKDFPRRVRAIRQV
jgi:DUF1680 family protein